MKKTLSTILGIVLCITALAGCSGNSNTPDSTPQTVHSGNSVTPKPSPADTQTAQPSVEASLAGKYILVSWEDEDGDYLEYLVSTGIRPESVYIELRSDGTYTWDLSALDMEVDTGTYKVTGATLILSCSGGEDVLTITDGRLYFEESYDILVFEQTGTASTSQNDFKESFPESAYGMYALISWTLEDGSDLVDEFLLDDIRSDLLYIDFMDDGRILLSLHAVYPGFFCWGTYWAEDGNIVIDWLEDWDASYFPYGATLSGSTVTLYSSYGERLEFDKEYSGGFPPSAVSYSDGYFGSPLGSAKTLDGTVLVVSIFVKNDKNSLWNDSLLAGFRQILRYSMLYLE